MVPLEIAKNYLDCLALLTNKEINKVNSVRKDVRKFLDPRWGSGGCFS